MTVIAAGVMFLCTPVAVWDGDGPVWCQEGPRVRISGIAARELPRARSSGGEGDERGSCSPGHPCPDATAVQARDALVNILGGPRGTLPTGHIRISYGTMRCRSTGGAGGNRTAAWCSLPDGRDLSCTLLATGTVARWERYWRDHRCS